MTHNSTQLTRKISDIGSMIGNDDDDIIEMYGQEIPDQEEVDDNAGFSNSMDMQNWMAPARVMPDRLEHARDALHINNKFKVGAQIGKQVVSKSSTILTAATNYSGGAIMGQAGWMALFTGASLSAGPISLLVASTALTIADSAKNLRSAYKTNQHIKQLDEILAHAIEYRCAGIYDPSHDHIINKVLPYIIAKKKKKKIRRAGSAVPVIGSAIEQTRAKAKATYKLMRDGGLGKNRKLFAHQLAEHHVRYCCGLTTAIIAELFNVSVRDAQMTADCDITELGAVLSLKMKSV